MAEWHVECKLNETAEKILTLNQYTLALTGFFPRLDMFNVRIDQDPASSTLRSVYYEFCVHYF